MGGRRNSWRLVQSRFCPAQQDGTPLEGPHANLEPHARHQAASTRHWKHPDCPQVRSWLGRAAAAPTMGVVPSAVRCPASAPAERREGVPCVRSSLTAPVSYITTLSCSKAALRGRQAPTCPAHRRGPPACGPLINRLVPTARPLVLTDGLGGASAVRVGPAFISGECWTPLSEPHRWMAALQQEPGRSPRITHKTYT